MKDLTFDTLAAVNLTRCQRWHDPQQWSPQMWGLAAAGEMGECCNALKKLHRHDEGIQQANTANDRETLVRNVAMEIGDVVVYLDLLAQRMGMRLEDCVTDTFNRVSAREGFPERLDGTSPRARKAINDIVTERTRQIQYEGYTLEHDDEHKGGEIARAAACYAVCEGHNHADLNDDGMRIWPDGWEFRDGGYRQNLVKAGALILAEIERLDRAQRTNASGRGR